MKKLLLTALLLTGLAMSPACEESYLDTASVEAVDYSQLMLVVGSSTYKAFPGKTSSQCTNMNNSMVATQSGDCQANLKLTECAMKPVDGIPGMLVCRCKATVDSFTGPCGSVLISELEWPPL